MKLFRLNRLFNPRSQRCFDVAIDRGFFNELGFLSGIERIETAIATLVDANPDAIQLTTITGTIFEVGFPDLIQQMWAAYLIERDGQLGARFGCATLGEALGSQLLFAAALRSQAQQNVVELDWDSIAEFA